MNCPNCGNTIAGTNTFCAYCGTKLDPVKEEPAAEEAVVKELEEFDLSSAVPMASEEESPAEEAPVEEVPVEEAPEEEVPAKKSKKEKAPKEKKQTSKGLLAAVIVLAVLFAAAAAAGVYLYLQNTEAAEALTARDVTIAQLETDAADLEGKLTDANAVLDELAAELTAQEDAAALLEEQLTAAAPKAEAYDLLCAELPAGSFGTGSENFKVDQGIVVVALDETEKTITLTANWEEESIIDVAYSSQAAGLMFPAEEWVTTATLTVVPQEVGLTVATFTNDKNEETFKVLLLVTEAPEADDLLDTDFTELTDVSEVAE